MVTVFNAFCPSSPTSTTFPSSLSLLIIPVFFMMKRNPNTPIRMPRLIIRITKPRANRFEILPLFSRMYSLSPTHSALRPTKVPQNPKANIQEPQDSSVPPVITVTPAIETTPLGRVTVSDFGSYVTVGVGWGSEERSRTGSMVNVTRDECCKLVLDEYVPVCNSSVINTWLNTHFPIQQNFPVQQNKMSKFTVKAAASLLSPLSRSFNQKFVYQTYVRCVSFSLSGLDPVI